MGGKYATLHYRKETAADPAINFCELESIV
jgi:hypothetical protein